MSVTRIIKPKCNKRKAETPAQWNVTCFQKLDTVPSYIDFTTGQTCLNKRYKDQDPLICHIVQKVLETFCTFCKFNLQKTFAEFQFLHFRNLCRIFLRFLQKFSAISNFRQIQIAEIFSTIWDLLNLQKLQGSRICWIRRFRPGTAAVFVRIPIRCRNQKWNPPNRAMLVRAYI